MSRVPGCWFSLGSLSKTGALLGNGYGGAIGRSFIRGGDRGLDRLRKRCFPGGRELTGKIGWIIRPCWVHTLPSSAHNSADWAFVSYREGSRVLGDVRSVPQSLKGHIGGDFVLGQPSLWLSQPVPHPVSGSRPLS